MTLFQRILIEVRGWPDNATRQTTRIVILQENSIAKSVTTAIANRLGGIHTIAMHVMETDEVNPCRDQAEMLRCQEILQYVTGRVQ